ncbi:hypothetical protein RsTz2092_07400 [Deferribacterales bacterium RsTz2092]|nr:hypothetical protein AGMMS49941_07350 [Deferribacterales bacterium]
MIDFAVKFYIIVLLLRWALTQQELNFNAIGKTIGVMTDFIFKRIKGTKSDSDKYIPVFILVLGFLDGLFSAFFSRMNAGITIMQTYRDLIAFLGCFFILAILLGATASSIASSAFTLFYRLGAIWIKAVRVILPIRSNFVAVPAILSVALISIALMTGLNFIMAALLHLGVLVPLILVSDAASHFVLSIVTMLDIYMWVFVLRALLSWLSPAMQSTHAQIIYYLTEPLLERVRRIVPQLGVFDVSVIVALAILAVLKRIIIQLVIHASL